MSRRNTSRKRRPVLGGIMLGLVLALMIGLFVVELTAGGFLILLAALAVTGGGLAGGTSAMAGESAVGAFLEALLSAIGEIFGAIFGFIGDLFSGFSL